MKNLLHAGAVVLYVYLLFALSIAMANHTGEQRLSDLSRVRQYQVRWYNSEGGQQ